MSHYSKEELDRLLKSTDKNIVIDALMYLCFNIDDPEWIQDKCIEAIESGKDEDVRGLGITCIGHVARMYSQINRKKVMPVLEHQLSNESLSGRAQDALDDIESFVK
ncbi:hypothetical protein [Paraburkholderia hospita]|jgi:hypothetical protein|uniref:Uncharacterized protein n=1 Tax=Paraburkholderia hospita TaxID=169430 RepID=A0AAJ4VZI7_9BURK|nr:hypothetical protein [Paraburkholderia hospita]SOE90945.1 hypothetical protein SAMN05446935_10264 [Burkholderia sp. YR290]AUT71492.1 hypothetical protein C2L64_24840 [Paraburkholderia hospita]AXF02446.1 hypothetical protein CUJ88_29545 [Paraburkholderia hospita]EIN03130.1 hypothetical protein WQE_00565 [Paraburkholderia hospita]OUL85658.1 hypothetical protein CA602_17635 [Paraburkholderia hospita]